MPAAIKLVREGKADPQSLDPFEEGDYTSAIKRYFGGHLADFRSRTFVDVGAGFGSRAHTAVSKLGAQVINADISQDAIVHLRELNQEKGVVADAYKLPFADNSVEGIISSNFINSSAVGGESDEDSKLNERDFMNEIARVLKKDGLFIQTNFGVGENARESWLALAVEAGFSDIEQIRPVTNAAKSRETRSTNKQRGWIGPLAFIARKSG